MRCTPLTLVTLVLWTLGASSQAQDVCLHDEHDRVVGSQDGAAAGAGVVAVGDGWAAVGAPNAGQVTLYRFNSQRWKEQQLLVDASSPSDQFGAAVDLDGDVLAVAEPRADVFDNGAGPEAGIVHVYRLVNSSWILEELVTPSDSDDSMLFGTSVAVEGNVLAVGTSDGRAYVFLHNGSSWVEQARFLDPDPPAFPEFSTFGHAIDTDGLRTIVGAPGWNGRGTAYSYLDIGGSWVASEQFLPQDATDGQQFGASVSLQGDRAAVGAPGDDDATGAVYAFERNGASWFETQKMLGEKDSDQFGTSISLRDERLAVGAPFADLGDRSDGGLAYAHHLQDGRWVRGVHLISSQGSLALSRFGASVDQHGDDTWVGAPAEDAAGADSGAAYAYRITELSFDVRADVLAEGDTAVFEACKGAPNERVLVVLTSWDGTPLFIPLRQTRFDAQGVWSESFVVPPGVGSATAWFEAYGFSSSGPKLVASWRDIVRFK